MWEDPPIDYPIQHIEWCPQCFDDGMLFQVVEGENGYPFCALHGTTMGRIVQAMPMWMVVFINWARHKPSYLWCRICGGHVRPAQGNDCSRCGAAL